MSFFERERIGDWKCFASYARQPRVQDGKLVFPIICENLITTETIDNDIDIELTHDQYNQIVDRLREALNITDEVQ